jgi:hypothetical protein
VRQLLAAALLAAATAAAEEPAVAYQALVTDERVDEISGLVASRQHPGVTWVHNDSGDAARLYALGADGALLATPRLRGARNIDWEDLAVREQAGRHLLLIADTGDNGGLRSELAIYAVEEPGTLQDARPRIAWKMRFRWPDGARDCEAMAVDPHSGEIYLVSKKRVPPELFRLPAAPRGERVETAEFVGHLSGIEQPSSEDLQRNPVYGRYRSQVTAADIAPDGLQLAVLNYRRAMVYTRGPGEDWRTAIGRAPAVFEFPWLPQAEALGFSHDGDALLIGTERVPTPLLRLPLRRSPPPR